jgi:pimeloyl-ACP methyl ester carboxylesterase
MVPHLESTAKAVKARPMDEVHYLAARGNHLAYRFRPGRGPTIVFLPGYMSDMDGGKATALDAWAAAEGRAMLRFDYAGCGLSNGDFEIQTLAGWRDDALAMIDEVAEGPVVLVGSSMGGWLMLLAALARPNRVAGLVGIASAPDFTSWGYTDAQKHVILLEGRLAEPSPYGESPYVTTRAFWESGEGLRLMHAPVALDCPVRLLHGEADDEVPWTWSIELMRRLRSADVQTILVKQGDHRLSRESDRALLIDTVKSLMERL